ncbi:MAG: hypothetical protein IKF19_06880 [Bacilli bacterium]|nr:hypothetical protein [Bacilli bacterium]
MKRNLIIISVLTLIFIPFTVQAKTTNYSTKPTTKIEEKYEVPILGKINAKEVSLPILAIVLGLVDGFNPCAMWILVFLISMLFGMKDRKKMWILGGTFILTSGLVYMLFMISWLNLAVFLTSVKLIRLLIAIFSIIFGMYNIYRYVDSLGKDDGCDVTDKEDRKKIMKKIKKITSNQKFILSIIGIMALAASVNVLELLCSLGLPVIFTNVLALNHLSTIEYSIYIFIYLLFFLIDDIIVFIIAMMSMKIKGISNKYTKYSHLVGGIIMLLLGILMAIKPEWLMFNF